MVKKNINKKIKRKDKKYCEEIYYTPTENFFKIAKGFRNIKDIEREIYDYEKGFTDKQIEEICIKVSDIFIKYVEPIGEISDLNEIKQIKMIKEELEIAKIEFNCWFLLRHGISLNKPHLNEIFKFLTSELLDFITTETEKI